MEKYSTNLNFLREKKGLSVQDVSKAMNVESIMVSKWERGELEPTSEEYEKLASIFGRTVQEIKESDMTFENNKVVSVKQERSKVGALNYLVFGAVWLVAVVLFAILDFGYGISNAWVCFIYAIPATCLAQVIMLVVRRVSLSNVKVVSYLSIFVWSLALALFLNFLGEPNMWIVFVAAVPLQALVLAFTKLIKR